MEISLIKKTHKVNAKITLEQSQNNVANSKQSNETKSKNFVENQNQNVNNLSEISNNIKINAAENHLKDDVQTKSLKFQSKKPKQTFEVANKNHSDNVFDSLNQCFSTFS